MNQDPAGRLDRIEAHLTHLEHQVEELNRVIVAQDKLLERLKKEVQRQTGALESLELERIRSSPAKPPHYQ